MGAWRPRNTDEGKGMSFGTISERSMLVDAIDHFARPQRAHAGTTALKVLPKSQQAVKNRSAGGISSRPQAPQASQPQHSSSGSVVSLRDFTPTPMDQAQDIRRSIIEGKQFSTEPAVATYRAAVDRAKIKEYSGAADRYDRAKAVYERPENDPHSVNFKDMYA